MAIPSVVSPVGALTTGTAPITVAMPPGALVNDVLIMQAQSLPATFAPVVANQAGGTWGAIGGLGGSVGAPGVRGTWFWSRYNGTQTAPTLSDTSGTQSARIVAVRGCITTGSPIHAQDIGAPTFAQTLSTLPTLTTTSNDCLILDCIVGELPDLDGTGVYGSWTNSALSTPTEVFDDSISTGPGGSLGMNTGGLHLGGATGTTSVTHSNMRVAYKKIALTPAVVSVQRIDKNARCQPVINGVPRFMRGIYDSGIAVGVASGDYVGHVAARDYDRYRFDHVIHVQVGTFGNALKLADALAPLGMFTLAIGNFFNGATFPPAKFDPALDDFDVRKNPSYSIPPATPLTPFRDLWEERAGALGTYLSDEPIHTATGWHVPTGGNFPTNLVTNPTFTTDLSGWTNDGSTLATWSAPGTANLPVGARLRQTVGGITPVVNSWDAYLFRLTLGGTKPSITVTSNGVTLYSSVHPSNTVATGAAEFSAGGLSGKGLPIRPTGTTIEIIATANAGGAGTLDDVGLFVCAGDPDTFPVTNTFVPVTRGRDDCELLQNLYKSEMPDLPTMLVFLNDNITQWREWSPVDICDWIGCDIYTIGTAPEQYPGNGPPGTESTYGYMNFSVNEAVSLARYYGPLYGRVPHVVLGFLKFGASSRFITLSEMWSHMVVAVAELRGVGVINWWAFGVQAGALHQKSGLLPQPIANGTTTVFLGPAGIVVEDPVDVEVHFTDVPQPQSSYTMQNLGRYEIVRVGNFWVPEFPFQVTFLTPPPAGTRVNIIVSRWPIAKKTAAEDKLEEMTHLLEDLEPIMIQPSNPALLTGNSNEAADFLAWRIPYTNLLRSGGGFGPVWLFGAIGRYQAEWAALTQATPDYTNSLHIMDQKANVRTCCWESGGIGIVAAHNVHPDPQANVELRWHTTITQVEVLGENRTIPVNGGTRWVDTFGGASSLRQGTFNTGHLYRLTLPTAPAFTFDADPGSYGVTGATTVLTAIAGPTLLAFVWRR